MAALANDGFIDPGVSIWSYTELMGLTFIHFGGVIMNPQIDFVPNLMGNRHIHYDGYYGTDNAPPPSSIKAGVTYGFNNALTGSLSISTEQWS